MSTIVLIFSILLANRVKAAQTSITTLNPAGEVNRLANGSTEAVFALQIRQIRKTTEAAPATSSGNNLNVVGAGVSSDSPHAHTESSQAISTIYSVENKEATDKKHTDEGKGNVKLLSSFDQNVTDNKEGHVLKNLENNMSITKKLRLVWDDCLKLLTSDNQKIIIKTQHDSASAKHESQFQNSRRKDENDSIDKRDILMENNLTTTGFGVEKYNSLRNVEIDKIPNAALTNKITQLSTTISPANAQIIPITTNIFEESTELLNTTVDVMVTENNIKASYTEDWFEARTKIRFGSLPQTETYLIPTLKLEEGFYPFGFLSKFFSLIYPFDFPVGLFKDIVWGKFTFPYSFIQTIKIESTFMVFIVTFVCMALVIPSYLLVLGILALLPKSNGSDEIETGALFPDSEDGDCNDKSSVVMTCIVVMLCCILISGMAVSNEQARAAAADSHSVVRCACIDIAAWLAAAARELYHSLVSPIDLVLHAYREDIRNVETLLGEPIQQTIASESGIDLVLDSLADIIAESEDLSTKISSLRDLSTKAGALASSTSDRIRDLARQLDILKRQCIDRDAQLCDTVNTNSLELKIKFDLVLREQQLLELRSLGVENLTRAIQTARQEFKILPSDISSQTANVRERLVRDMEARRQGVHSSARVLNDMARHLTAGLHSIARQLDAGLTRVRAYEFWSWIVMLASVGIFTFMMALILIAMLCGCGKAKVHAKRTLQASTALLCLASLILWSVVSAIFLIAGHAEVYICHALWDTEQYKTLSNLLDRPSPLFSNNEGIFDALFRDLENTTIDVSVRDVLRDCEKNHPAYIVFQLDKVLDVNKETSYFEWEELQADLEGLSSSIDVGFLKTVSVNFNKLLSQMLTVSDVTLAKYRLQYNGPVVGKDLPSLVDQLENIATKISDLTTAGKLETLATRAQRLYVTNVKPLEQSRADLIYKLTELELRLMPFRRKLNISLSHIHTAQFYIDNQGDVIAQKKVSTYVSRLLTHTANWRMHVLTSVGQHAARCRPLFTVYDAARTLLCTKYVSSLHGWWLCGLVLGLLWCTALTPLCVKLWRAYGRRLRSSDSMALSNLSSGQQGTPTVVMDDSSNWNTPGTPPTRNDSW